MQGVELLNVSQTQYVISEVGGRNQISHMSRTNWIRVTDWAVSVSVFQLHDLILEIR